MMRLDQRIIVIMQNPHIDAGVGHVTKLTILSPKGS